MNKKLLSFAMVFLLSLSFTVNTYAMDKRVKSSKSWTVTKEITKKEAKENKKSGICSFEHIPILICFSSY